MNNLARSTVSPEKLAAKWNHSFPIGTKVRYWPGAREGRGVESATKTQAEVLGGHTAVVWIEGRGDCIALSHVEPLPTS